MILIHMDNLSAKKLRILECLLEIEMARQSSLRKWVRGVSRLRESDFDDVRIKDANSRIDDLRREIERQRHLIKGMKERKRRRDELERLRRNREKEQIRPKIK